MTSFSMPLGFVSDSLKQQEKMFMLLGLLKLVRDGGPSSMLLNCLKRWLIQTVLDKSITVKYSLHLQKLV
jgi:hypothetical protein